ncbi:MAG: hypothetical protein JWO05_3150 [Gemmatimonadetes bacterium]|nr:hypothetical protein [Gemmatimonadota bacterium]
MNHEFTVDPGHLIKLVDAVQAGALDLDALDTICFCLEASGNFTWDADTPDGERVANGLFWLGSPEVNYALTESVMAKIRDYLVTGRESFTDDDPRSPAEG